MKKNGICLLANDLEPERDVEMALCKSQLARIIADSLVDNVEFPGR